MNIENLKTLTDIVNNNEDVLVNKSKNIGFEVFQYCLEELKKIEAEESKVLECVRYNKKALFEGSCSPVFEYSSNCPYDGKEYLTWLGLSSEYIRDNYPRFDGYSNIWKKLTSSEFSRWYKMYPNMTTEDWCRSKNMIDFRRWSLGCLVKEINTALTNYIGKQKTRMNGIVETCNKIDEERVNNNSVKVEITIYK